MELGEVIRRVKTEKTKLAELNVKSLAIFGSVARGEERSGSDIDFLVEFKGPATFDSYMGLKIFLEDLLENPVDLVTSKGVRPELKPHIERELRYVA